MENERVIVIASEEGLLVNTEDEVIVFKSEKDAIKCVDDGRTYLDLDYSYICEAILPEGTKTEIFDTNKEYFN